LSLGGRRQEAGGRRQEAEGRRQKAEGRRQKAEGRWQVAGGRCKMYLIQEESAVFPFHLYYGALISGGHLISNFRRM